MSVRIKVNDCGVNQIILYMNNIIKILHLI